MWCLNINESPVLNTTLQDCWRRGTFGAHLPLQKTAVPSDEQVTRDVMGSREKRPAATSADPFLALTQDRMERIDTSLHFFFGAFLLNYLVERTHKAYSRPQIVPRHVLKGVLLSQDVIKTPVMKDMIC